LTNCIVAASTRTGVTNLSTILGRVLTFADADVTHWWSDSKSTATA